VHEQFLLFKSRYALEKNNCFFALRHSALLYARIVRAFGAVSMHPALRAAAGSCLSVSLSGSYVATSPISGEITRSESVCYIQQE